MGIPAFTQSIGTKVLYDNLRGTGEYVNNLDHSKDGTYDWYIYNVPIEISVKPSPVHGDRKRAFDYHRSVKKLLSQEPCGVRTTTIYANSPWEVRTEMSPFYGYWSQYLDYVPGGDSGDRENAYDESITKARNDLISNSAGIGADLFQARQSIDELAALASRFCRVFLALKRGNFDEAAQQFTNLTGKHINVRSAQRSLADLWLQMSYGITPTMSDLVALQGIVHDALNAVVPVTGKGKGKLEKDETSYTPDGLTKIVSHVTDRSKTVLLGAIDNPYLAGLNSAGLINPLSIAWELVPWSFAIDWFVPIGQTLTACTAGVGIKDLGGYTSSHQDVATTMTAVTYYHDNGAGHISEVFSSGFAQIQGFSFSRVAHTNWPVPDFYVDNTPYSTQRALNALALVRQLV